MLIEQCPGLFLLFDLLFLAWNNRSYQELYAELELDVTLNKGLYVSGNIFSVLTFICFWEGNAYDV